MASKSKKKKRNKGNFPLRLNKRDMAKFEARATTANLSMNKYARAKILDIPLEHVEGKPERRRSPRPEETPPPASE